MSPIHIVAKHGSVEVLELMWTWCGVMREDHMYQPFGEQDGVSVWMGREREGGTGKERNREGEEEREGKGESDWCDRTLTNPDPFCSVSGGSTYSLFAL